MTAIRWCQVHAKAILAALGAVVASVTAVASDGVHGVTEWTLVGVAVATAVQVYLVPELEHGAASMAKGLCACVFAVAAALTPAVAAGGLDGSEMTELAAVGIAAIAVLLVPNAGYRFARKPGLVR